MSDAIRAAIQQGDADGALLAAESALEGGEIDALTQRILELLVGESAWVREGTLSVLHRLRPDERLLKRLFSELSSGDHPERRNAARSALAAMATPGAADPAAPLPHLLDGIRNDPDVDVRILCANALGESQNPRAREALEAALEDPQPNVVAAAAEALGTLNDPRAVEALVALAERRDFWTGNAAVMALGVLGDARATPALVALTSDPWLATEAARALGRMGDSAGLDALRDMIDMPEDPRQAAVRAAADIVGRTGVAAPGWLRAVLRDEVDSLIKEFRETGEPECARLLGLAGTEGAAAALLTELRDDPDGAAAVGLEHLPEEIRAEALLKALDTATEEELPTLLSHLPSLRSRNDLERVASFLTDARAEIHAAAADALSRADAERVLAVLAEVRRDPSARLGVALAYGRLGSNRCTPLLEMLGDPDPRVRAAAAEGTGRCGLATAGELAAALGRESDPETARALLRALGTAGGHEAVETLQRELRSEDAAHRFEAVRALGCTGSAEAFAPLLEALSDPEPGVRTVALAALGDLGDVRAEEPLTAHIEDPDRDRRRIAAAAIERLSSVASTGKLEASLRDPDREVRLVAVNALARLRLPGSAEALERVAAEDADPLVRNAAAAVAASLQDRAAEDS